MVSSTYGGRDGAASLLVEKRACGRRDWEVGRVAVAVAYPVWMEGLLRNGSKVLEHEYPLLAIGVFQWSFNCSVGLKRLMLQSKKPRFAREFGEIQDTCFVRIGSGKESCPLFFRIEGEVICMNDVPVDGKVGGLDY